MSRNNISSREGPPDDCSVNSGLSWGGNSYNSHNSAANMSVNSRSGGVTKVKKVKLIKDAEVPGAGTMEFIQLRISSTKREIQRLKAVSGETPSTSQASHLRLMKKKLKDLLIMLDSTKSQQSRGTKPSMPDKNIVKAPFSSSGKRDMHVKNLLSETPHFYLCEKDWNFGSAGFGQTIKMDSFNYSENYKNSLDMEKFTQMDILVGMHRPQSRCKETDFFGTLANNVIRSRSFSPIAVPKLKE